MADLTTVLQENVTGIRIVAFAQEDRSGEIGSKHVYLTENIRTAGSGILFP